MVLVVVSFGCVERKLEPCGGEAWEPPNALFLILFSSCAHIPECIADNVQASVKNTCQTLIHKNAERSKAMHKEMPDSVITEKLTFWKSFLCDNSVTSYSRFRRSGAKHVVHIENKSLAISERLAAPIKVRFGEDAETSTRVACAPRKVR